MTHKQLFICYFDQFDRARYFGRPSLSPPTPDCRLWSDMADRCAEETGRSASRCRSGFVAMAKRRGGPIGLLDARAALDEIAAGNRFASVLPPHLIADASDDLRVALGDLFDAVVESIQSLVWWKRRT